MGKSRLYLTLVLALAILIINLSSINPVGEVSYCCEKTKAGAWCQNAPQTECDASTNPITREKFRAVPTSCQATNYCRLGWCYDSQEGTCMPNTPQLLCNNNGGVWSSGSEEPPQCSLGCCTVGDQAAFVTQTRCKRISAIYGLNTNFRTDIADELECLASVTSETKGACVFEREFEKTCRLLTQRECRELEQSSEADITFYAGYLCSAEELGTNCGPTERTTCIEERDEVYFLDSCGNLANIYDASKIKNKEYWARIKTKEESCGPESSNANDKNCGNCDYYLGSTCKQYDRTKDKARPSYGNNLCRDLSCKWEGKPVQHGETWCATNTKLENVPGSEYFRLVCYNNEVTIEQCSPFRQEVCIESETNGFNSARCSANLWRDCVAQDNQQDCVNTDLRDCKWIKDGGKWQDDNATLGHKKGEDSYVCTPNFAPGFDFWNAEGESTNICSISNNECVATFKKGLFDDKWECVGNCHCCVNDEDGDGENENTKCTGNKWVETKKALCNSLGDCGDKSNYLGTKGYPNRSVAMRDGKTI